MFSLLLPSCLVSSSLVLSLFLRLSFSVFSLSPSVSLCPCLSLSPCGVVGDVLLCFVLCCCGGVVCGVCCVAPWKPSVSTHNVPVCPSQTSPCVPAPRAHVETHVRLVLLHTGTFRMYPRRKAGGSLSVLLTKICPHRFITWPRGSPKSNHKILQISSVRIRSRTTRARFLQSFALPDEAVELQLSWGKQATRLFDSFSPISTGITNDLNVNIATSLHQRLPFSNLIHHLSSPDSNHFQNHGT